MKALKEVQRALKEVQRKLNELSAFVTLVLLDQEPAPSLEVPREPAPPNLEVPREQAPEPEPGLEPEPGPEPEPEPNLEVPCERRRFRSIRRARRR